MRREISWVLRFLITVGCVAGAVTKETNDNKKYPLGVHQMFQQRMNKNSVIIGMWTSWSHWSPCTRSCGGGVAMQTRDCKNQEQPVEGARRRRVVIDAGENAFYNPGNNTPHMKSQCVGVYKRFHICNDQACPPGSIDFRRLQCETFNGKKFMGRSYLWEPFLDAPNKCELNCRAVGYRFYATLNKTAVDGTSCHGATNDRWVCVSGLCKTGLNITSDTNKAPPIRQLAQEIMGQCGQFLSPSIAYIAD
ncbi:papilin-like [Periplaneta americana]|uniref:papilin-like n=1 Tax=Periplaneta americana TaxID=6978 RepID=UPI0037E93C88